MAEGIKVGDAFVEVTAKLTDNTSDINARLASQLRNVTVQIKAELDTSSLNTVMAQIKARTTTESIKLKVEVDNSSLNTSIAQIKAATSKLESAKIKTELDNSTLVATLAKLKSATAKGEDVKVKAALDDLSVSAALAKLKSKVDSANTTAKIKSETDNPSMTATLTKIKTTTAAADAKVKVKLDTDHDSFQRLGVTLLTLGGRLVGLGHHSRTTSLMVTALAQTIAAGASLFHGFGQSAEAAGTAANSASQGVNTMSTQVQGLSKVSAGGMTAVGGLGAAIGEIAAAGPAGLVMTAIAAAALLMAGGMIAVTAAVVGALAAGAAFTAMAVAAGAVMATLATAVAAAASAVAILPAALAGAAGGFAVLLIAIMPVMKAFSAFMSLQDSAGKSAEDSAQKHVQGARQIADAEQGVQRAKEQSARSIQSAADSVASAQRKEEDAQKNLTSARQKAGEEIQELQSKVAGLAEKERDAGAAIQRAQEQTARSVADAADSVVSAQRKEQDSQKSLTSARKAAADQIQDLQERVLGLANDEEGARIRLVRAQESLNKANQDAAATDLDRREKLHGVHEAELNLDTTLRNGNRTRLESNAANAKGVEGSDQVQNALKGQQDAAKATSDAQKNLAQTQTDGARAVSDAQKSAAKAHQETAEAQAKATEAARKGVEGSDQVQNALKGQQDAARATSAAQTALAQAQTDGARAVSDAQKALARAHEDVAQAQAKNTSQANAYDQAMSKLGAGGVLLEKSLEKLKGTMEVLAKSFGDRAFPGFVQVLDTISGLLTGPLLGSMNNIASAMGQVASQFATMLSDKTVVTGLQQIFNAGAEAIRAIGPGVIEILKGLIQGMGNLAQAAGPVMTAFGEGLRQMGPAFKTFFDAFAKPEVIQALTQAMQGLFTIINGAISWLGPFLAEISKVGGPLLQQLSGPLLSIIKSIGDMLIQFVSSGLLDGFVKLMEGVSAGFKTLADSGVMKKLGDAFGQVLAALGPVIDRLIKDLTPHLPAVIDGFKTLALAFVNMLPSLTPLIPLLTSLFTQFVQQITPHMPQLITAFVQLAGAFLQMLPALLPMIPQLMQMMTIMIQLTAVALKPLTVLLMMAAVTFTFFMQAAITSFNAVVAGIQAGWELLKALFNASLEFIKGVWNAAWGWIKDVASTVWNAITGVISGAFEGIKNLLNAGLEFVKNLWNTVWNAIKDIAATIWNAITGVISSAWEGIKNLFNTALEFVKNLWNTGLTWIKDKASELWGTIKQVFTDALEAIKGAFQTGVDAIKVIWDKIQEIAKIPVKFVIETVVNEGVLKVWNWLAEKIPGDIVKKMEPMPLPAGFASGGMVYGPGTGTSDDIPARLSAGEFVVNAADTRRHRRLLDQINNGVGGVAEGYAAGGMVNREYSIGQKTIERVGLGNLNALNKQGDITFLSGDPSGMKVKQNRYTGVDFSYAQGGTVPHCGSCAVYGFAAGGDVTAKIAATHAWLKQQAGKPYVMGANGPGAYDCTGLVGAVQKSLEGQTPEGGGRFSTVDQAAHFQPGFGGTNDLNSGWYGGGGAAGHSVGSIGGLNFEATPPVVLVGNVNMTAENPAFVNKGHHVVGGGTKFTGGGGGGGGGGISVPNPLRGLFDAFFKTTIEDPLASWSADPNKLGGETFLKPHMRGAATHFKDKVKEFAHSKIPATIFQAGGGGGGDSSVGPDAASIQKTAFETAKGMGADARVLLALFEAGNAESNWRSGGSVGGVDHDSYGFLQQRIGSGIWGTKEQVEDPAHATRKFVEKAMGKSGTAGDVAQQVQQSGHPGRYNQKKAQAVQQLAALGFNGPFDGMAMGGSAPDTIDARLSDGEYVVNAKSASQNLELLERINSGIPGFDTGGLVRGFAAGGLTKDTKTKRSKDQPDDMAPITWLAGAIHADIVWLAAQIAGGGELIAVLKLVGQGITNAVKDVGDSLASKIDGGLRGLEDTLKKVGDSLAGKLDGIYKMVGETMQGVDLLNRNVGPLAGIRTYLIEAANGIIAALNAGFTLVGGAVNNAAPAPAAPPAMASGGMISGPGGPKEDAIAAKLSAGEFVVNAVQAKKYLPLLTALNAGVLGFATGGLVGFAEGGMVGGGAGVTPAEGKPGDIQLSMTVEGAKSWKVLWATLHDTSTASWGKTSKSLDTTWKGMLGKTELDTKTTWDKTEKNFNTTWVKTLDDTTKYTKDEWQKNQGEVYDITKTLFTVTTGFVDKTWASTMDQVKTGAVNQWTATWQQANAISVPGMNAVVATMNEGIKAVNTVLTAVGLTFQIPAVVPVVAKAEGGPIHGPGTGTSDSINARLSDGEYVINAKSTAKHFALIEAINDSAYKPGFAQGGIKGTRPLPHKENEFFTPYDLLPGFAAGGLKAEGLRPGMGRDLGAGPYLVKLMQKFNAPGSFGNSYRPGDPLWHGCVPMSTQVLTKRGWISHEDIRFNEDETIGYNPETGKNEWTLIVGSFKYDDAELWTIGNKHVKYDVTPNHKWLADVSKSVQTEIVCTECGREFETGRGMTTHRGHAHNIYTRPTKRVEEELVTTDSIRRNDKIHLAKLADLGGTLPITDAEAELLGWVMGDGYIETNPVTSATVVQSKPWSVVRLRRFMTQFPHSEYMREPEARQTHKVYRFRLEHAFWDSLATRSGATKQGASTFVLAMSPSQRSAWLRGMLAADGTRDPRTLDSRYGYSVFQVSGPVAEALKLAIYLEGYRPDVRVTSEFDDDHFGAQPIEHIGLRTPSANGRALEVSNKRRETVWCPTTKLGTWTARQGDDIFLTGNSGLAMDYMGYNQDDASYRITKDHGGQLLEYIHAGNKGVYGVSMGKAHDMGGQLWSEHRNHVHVAASLGALADMLGGVLGPPGSMTSGPPPFNAAEAMAKIIPAIDTEQAKLPKTGMGQTYYGAWDKIQEGLKKKADAQQAASAAATGGGDLAPGGGSIQQQALRQAKSMNASAKVLLALFEAGNVESHWANSSVATDHDSVGFLQQRPSTGWGTIDQIMNVAFATRSFVSRAMAKEHGAATAGQLAQMVQISAYPSKYDAVKWTAVAQLQALGEYGPFANMARGGMFRGANMDEGGYLPPGATTVFNNTGKREQVLTPGQSQALQKNIEGSGGQQPVFVTVLLDGEVVTEKARAEVDANNVAVVSAFRRGR